MMFFRFHQNNSGGSFDYTEDLGENVLIEASSAAEANEKLEALGGYFDGCYSGQDCPCCGDRWYAQDYDSTDGYNVFATAEEVIKEHAPDPEAKWESDKQGRQLVVHYADGRREWHQKDVRF